MRKELWLKNSFIDANIPEWKCPTCNNGPLKIEAKQFHFQETKLSLSWHSEEEWEPEFTTYRFHGTLKCQNCGDLIVFMGRGAVDHFHDYDEYIREYSEGYNNVFYPLYFHPNLRLFEINENCPYEIKKEIEDSFGLYWNDLPSCANKIRTSLELLMNQQKVRKSFIKNGKRKDLSLHQRIEEFKKSKPETADFLLAIKWIGNTGSHVGEIINIDILETYELLEHSINKLFDDTENKLKKISKEIIKRKGTRKRKN